MNRIINLLLIGVLIATAGAATAQVNDPNRIQFQLAQRYEAMGDFENALTIYFDLTKKVPGNYTYFDGLARCYINLKRYDQLITLLNERLRKFPNHLQYLVKLGDAYLRKGDEQKALEIWNALLSQRKKEIGAYQLIANAWMMNRQYDKAIEVYEAGRRQIGNPALFSIELAQLYAYRLNYDLATEEYLRYLKLNPRQYAYIEGRLASFKGDFQTYQQVSHVLKEWIKKNPQQETYRRLYVSFLVSFQNYEEAYNQVKELEALRQRLSSEAQPGSELFRFGQTALGEEQYKLAERAFSELLSHYPDYENRARVEYELARTFFLQNKYKKALDHFEQVVDRFPQSKWALEAQLQRGEIYLNKMFSLDSAASVFKQILTRFPKHDERARAFIALGDVEVARNRLDEASRFYKQSINSLVRNIRLKSSVQIEGNLKLARLAFFRNDFQTAKKHIDFILKQHTNNFSNVLINDALELLFLIDQNIQEYYGALGEFADASLLSRQNRLQEAAERFEKIAISYPQAPLIPQALFQSAQLKERQNDFLGAVLVMDKIIENYPNSNLCDLALWSAGQIYENKIKNLAKAIDRYEAILLHYPDSILVDKVRKRIRNLEGNL